MAGHPGDARLRHVAQFGQMFFDVAQISVRLLEQIVAVFLDPAQIQSRKSIVSPPSKRASFRLSIRGE
jgi:hypothetical protein